MGLYYEPRPPSGSPSVGEKDVWLNNGEIKLGHWDGSAWVVDATVSSDGLVGEKGPTGDEGPPCPTGGNADTLDGYHASAFDNTRGSWVPITVNTSNWQDDGYCSICKFTNGTVWLHGQLTCKSSSGYDIGDLPSGYCPPVSQVLGWGLWYGSSSNNGMVALRVCSSNTFAVVNMCGKTLSAGGTLDFDIFYSST